MIEGGLRPNDSPWLELGELRMFQFELAADVGHNKLTSAQVSGRYLELSEPGIQGSSVYVFCEPKHVGTHILTLTVDLASDERLVKRVRVHCRDSSHWGHTGRDYGN